MKFNLSLLFVYAIKWGKNKNEHKAEKKSNNNVQHPKVMITGF